MKNKKRFKKIMTGAALAVSAMLMVGAVATGCDGCNKSETISNRKKGTTYYIGTPIDGVKQDGKSVKTPYNIREFFSSHIKDVKPGDIIKVCPGEHLIDIPVDSEQDIEDGIIHDKKLTISVSGTYDNYIIFEPADPKEKTVLNFKNQLFESTARGVQMDGDYIYWHDIDICGAGDNGMYVGGDYNVVENCEFYNNRDTGLQLGRSQSSYSNIKFWPSYNLIKNCTAYNNYDNETAGENADGFAAKLTVGYGNIFDGCIAYRNSDDGWDLYGKPDSGNIGRVIMYNCIAFENGYLMDTQKNCNDWYGESYNTEMDEVNTNSFVTKDGDGNGFKLGGSTMAGDVKLENCLAFNNRMHGVTDNSNPGLINIDGVTSYNNGAVLDTRSHLGIKDVNGKTSSLYHAIGSDGYITRADGYKAVINEAGETNGEYNTVDKDGYILMSDNTFYMDGEEKVKGSYIKAATDGQTPNPTFGHVSIGANGADYGNINMARTAASYNALKNVLSVNNGSLSLIGDEFKGATQNCLLSMNGTKSFKIDGQLDASQIAEDDGTQKHGEVVDAPKAEDIFEALPANDLGLRKDIHTAWRNEDGSINVGSVLKVKDYSLLLGEEKKIGCDLSKATWEDYTHYTYTYLTDRSIKSEDQAELTAVKNMLYYPGDPEAVYQDFNLVAEIGTCEVTWTSSDPDIISIGEEVTTIQPCEGKIVRAIVNRPTDGDKEVTLTATLKLAKGATDTYTTTVNVKKNTCEIGEIVIENVTEDGYVILEYGGQQPKFEITNAADYNGKLLAKDMYTVTTTAKYGSQKGASMTNYDAADLDVFMPITTGVFEITQNIAIGEQSKAFTYMVYVVSPDGDIQFATDKDGGRTDAVNATHDGYMISGELTNVAGKLYTMVAGSAPDEATLKANGECYDITKDKISASFKHSIDEEFTVYYGVYNLNGVLKSEIYSKKITIEEISTKDQFKSLIQTGGETNKIYKLTSDLDFTGDTLASSSNAFGGVLDGCGHTIRNISITNNTKGKANLIYKLDGGTIMNINFDHITIDGKEQVGIISQAYSGYLSNIRMTEIRATGDSRIGALIGQVFEQTTTPLIIERVSLVNTESDKVIYGTSTKSGRVAGIIGFIQTNSSDSLESLKIDVRVSNCYVDARIGDPKSQQCGGIIGTYDTSTQAGTKGFTYSMSIDSCYFVGTVLGRDRVSGIISYQQGVGKLRVRNCVSVGDLYFKGRLTTMAEKNSSCIFGGYVATADTTVSNCWGLFGDHNGNYDVSPVSRAGLVKSFWENYTSFDLENIWVFDENNPHFISLR